MSAASMPTSIPSIHDLGRRIAALYVEHNRLDEEGFVPTVTKPACARRPAWTSPTRKPAQRRS